MVATKKNGQGSSYQDRANEASTKRNERTDEGNDGDDKEPDEGENSVENPIMTNVATPQEGKKEELVFPMMYTHPQAQTSQKVYPTMIPQSRGFPIIYPFAPMVQMTNAGQ